MIITKQQERNLIVIQISKSCLKKQLSDFKPMTSLALKHGNQFAKSQEITSAKSIKDSILNFKNLERAIITHLSRLCWKSSKKKDWLNKMIPQLRKEWRLRKNKERKEQKNKKKLKNKKLNLRNKKKPQKMVEKLSVFSYKNTQYLSLSLNQMEGIIMIPQTWQQFSTDCLLWKQIELFMLLILDKENISRWFLKALKRLDG